MLLFMLYDPCVSDGNVFVYRSREGEIMQYDAERNVSTLIMDNSTFVSPLICLAVTC